MHAQHMYTQFNTLNCALFRVLIHEYMHMYIGNQFIVCPNKMVFDKMVGLRTKWYGQNGTDKMVAIFIDPYQLN